MSRFPDTKTAGGSLKSFKRSLRHELKRRDLTVTQRRGLKERLAALLAIKDQR